MRSALIPACSSDRCYHLKVAESQMQAHPRSVRCCRLRPLAQLTAHKPRPAVGTINNKPRLQMETAVLPISHAISGQDLVSVLQQVHERTSRLRIWLHDWPAAAADPQLLHWLEQLYGAVAAMDPCWDVVPLLPFAGWTPERVSQLGQQLAPLPAAAPSPTTTSAPPAAAAPHAPSPNQLPMQQQGPRPAAAQPTDPLAFPKVAVGGTFDHLHAGHRLLLAATALVAVQDVFIGVTADALLANKRYAQLLECYDSRQAAAVDCVTLVRPSLRVATGALKDPQAPTQAELDPDMAALVVSHETLPGGQAINSGRMQRGYLPLQLVQVGLVGSQSGSTADLKLSSTELRHQLMLQQQQQQQQQQEEQQEQQQQQQRRLAV